MNPRDNKKETITTTHTKKKERKTQSIPTSLMKVCFSNYYYMYMHYHLKGSNVFNERWLKFSYMTAPTHQTDSIQYKEK